MDSREKSEMAEIERQEALDKLADLDVHSYNKAQKFPGLSNPHEESILPTIGPGPMTASAVIVDCGILEKEKRYISAAKSFLGIDA